MADENRSPEIMGRQIRFFLSAELRSQIVAEASRRGAILAPNHPDGDAEIQFSESSGTDTHQGRLWTEALTEGARADYEALCRVVKQGAGYDSESGLWFKRASKAEFHAYRMKKKSELEALAERNRRFAVDHLGARLTK